ncbi:MAG: plasminogen activator [Desulforhopalus sp.]|jgi:plasminogen activator
MKRLSMGKKCLSVAIALGGVVVCYGSTAVAADVTTGPVAVAPGKTTEVVELAPPSKAVRFTLGVGAGYLSGESTELVYVPELNNYKLSELTWKIDNLFMVGVNGVLEVGSWLSFNFDGWFKATDGDGTMDDYDWLAQGYDWTHWSHHEDTDVTDGSIIDVSANFAFFRAQNAVLTGIVGYKRDNFGWEARGGDYTYSYGGFRDYSGSFADGELGISYEQTMESFYGGLGFSADFSNRFHLAGRVIYSPFVQGEATDYHHMRNIVFYDDFEDGDLIAFDLSGTFGLTEKLGLEVGFQYQKYDTMQGDGEWHSNGEVGYYEDGAGMDQSSTMITTSLLYTF